MKILINLKKMFKIIRLCIIVTLLFTQTMYAQNVGINSTGATPNAAALLDIDASPGNNKGLLIPRLTTAQRDAISSPVESLMIYNTDSHCFEAYYGSWVSFGCIGCQIPAAFAANAASGITGTSFTANWAVSGGATNYYLDVSTENTFASFVAGYNNLNVGNVLTFNVTPLTCGTYYYRVRASNACGISANSNTITLLLSAIVANAGTDINLACGVTTATLAAIPPTVGTGTWSVVSGTATITSPNSPTSGVTDMLLSCTTILRWTIEDSPCIGFDEVVITPIVCAPACGTQVWMQANMNTGTQVSLAIDQAPGQKWCYNDISANCDNYGGFYQWHSAMNLSGSGLQYGANLPSCNPCGSTYKGICPVGYHIPSDNEWSQYEYCIENNIAPTGNTSYATFSGTIGLRGSFIADVSPGTKMKMTPCNDISMWWDGTNASGFSALPAGCSFSGSSDLMLMYAFFWSATEYNDELAWIRFLSIGIPQASREYFSKSNGYSVRCLQD